MAILILLRHGKSLWNDRNLFTGWVDVPLSKVGVEEAQAAGRQIRDLPIDLIYTSSLIRAQMTAMISMLEHASGKVPVIQHAQGELARWGHMHGAAKDSSIPVFCAWQLNERMYGELQGLDKDETRAKFGKEQVHIWRRSFDVAPPQGESLEMTAARTLPYFEEEIVPQLALGKNVFICAHGNSLRSIIMYLKKLSPEQVVQLELETGFPVVYTYNDGIFTEQLWPKASI